MKKGQNFNRPEKGSCIKVQPIKKTKDIQRIKNLLKNQPRNYALFVIGINTNLRASDIRKLKVEQVKNLNPGDFIEIKEQKTSKFRKVSFNKSCIDAINRLLLKSNLEQTGYLFKNRYGGLLTVPSISRLVKRWCKSINLQGNYGSHSLRKTWGYHQRVTYEVDLPNLMVCFNHSSQKQTLDYLCIQPEEIQQIFSNEI